MPRPIVTAELLSIGTELTTGATRDTNAGDLAAELTAAGVSVARITALPDDLGAVTDAFAMALGRVDLAVSTGGLGPTPDDLTREAIAAAIGEPAAVDAALEAWLRGLWTRRRMPFPEGNLKQAWLVPSATAIANPNGTAPGWWVDRPDGRVVVALPGPPREMWPMWRDWVGPRLRERGLGVARVSHTIRTVGIGESVLAERLGDLLLAPNPVVATYAKVDGVDIRVSAVDEQVGTDVRPADGPTTRSAEDLAAEALTRVREIVGEHAWGRDGDTWPGVIAEALGAGPWSLAIVELGTGGATGSLLGSIDALIRAEALGTNDPDRPTHETRLDAGSGLIGVADRVRAASSADVVIAADATDRRDDTTLHVVVLGPGERRHDERRMVFLRGDEARGRVAAAAAHVLLGVLRQANAEVAS